MTDEACEYCLKLDRSGGGSWREGDKHYIGCPQRTGGVSFVANGTQKWSFPEQPRMTAVVLYNENGIGPESWFVEMIVTLGEQRTRLVTPCMRQFEAEAALKMLRHYTHPNEGQVLFPIGSTP